MANRYITEQMQICEGWLPLDLQTARTGDWVSLKNYEHLSIVFYAGVGTAGDDPTITVEQATDVSGTSAKAVNFTRLYTKQAATNLQSTGTFTKVTQSAANTYTDATSAEIAKLWVIDIDAQDLDVDGGFDCVRASCSDVGTNAQLGCCLYLLTNPAHALATLPTAIA